MNNPYSKLCSSQSELFLSGVGRDFVFCKDSSLFFKENRVGNKRRLGDMVEMNIGLGLRNHNCLIKTNKVISFIEQTLVALQFLLHIHD